MYPYTIERVMTEHGLRITAVFHSPVPEPERLLLAVGGKRLVIKGANLDVEVLD